MQLLTIVEFIGRFHPLFVHLPIGFLLLAVLFSFISIRIKQPALQEAVPFTLFVGGISAVFACVSGYLLSLGGDYNETTLSFHMWTGIATAVLSLVAWLISLKKIPVVFLQSRKVFSYTLLLLLVLISAAGHFGGSLTHGDDYLTAALVSGKKEKKVLASMDEAVVYTDVVAPILENKCTNCHNSSKMKGKLSLETFTAMMKGGKHGAVIQPGNSAGSELIKRVLLDPSDEKFMPTDGKPALTDNEKAILQWWIGTLKADENITMAKAAPPENVKASIQAQLGFGGGSEAPVAAAEVTSGVTENYWQKLNVPAVGDAKMEQLTKAGWVVKKISNKPDWLDVTFRNAAQDVISPEAWKALVAVKDNVIWLNVAGNNVTDDQVQQVTQFANLQRLRLDKNPISDAGVQQLKVLDHLEAINLVSTKITNESVRLLSNMSALKKAYLWETASGIKKDSTLNIENRSLRFVAGAN